MNLQSQIVSLLGECRRALLRSKCNLRGLCEVSPSPHNNQRLHVLANVKSIDTAVPDQCD